MTIPQLKKALSVFGTLSACSERSVLTILITGTDLLNAKKVMDIGKTITSYAEDKFPVVEVCVNGNDFFLCVLKK